MEELIEKYLWKSTDIHLENGFYIAVRGDIITIYEECKDWTWMTIYHSVFSEENFIKYIVDELWIKEWDYK